MVTKGLRSFLDHCGGMQAFRWQDSKPTQVVEQLLSSVLARPQMEEVWVFINELGVHSAMEKLIVTEHVLQERDVGLKGKGEQREGMLRRGSVSASLNSTGSLF